MNSNSWISIYKTNDGKILGSGNNVSYQLGFKSGITDDDGQTIEPLQEHIVQLPIDGKLVKKFSTGREFTVFLMKDGTVKGCGNNTQYQLGSDIDASFTTTSNSYKYVVMTDLAISGVKDIACGGYHTVFLMEDGSVMVCGSNSNGQLGLDKSITKSKITKLETVGNKVKKVICAYMHTLFLMEDGSIMGCGDNSMGQLAKDSTEAKIYEPITLPITQENLKYVYLTSFNTYFLMNDGTVKGCGNNRNGELGKPRAIQKSSDIIDLDITDVDNISGCGNNLLFFLKDGTVKGCGGNSYGALCSAPTQNFGFIDLPITDVADCYSGVAHNIFLMKDGTVKGCGYALDGELDVDKTEYQLDYSTKRGINEIVNIAINGVMPWHYEFGDDNEEKIVYTETISSCYYVVI